MTATRSGRVRRRRGVDVVPAAVGAIAAALVLFAVVGSTPAPTGSGLPDESAPPAAPVGDGAAANPPRVLDSSPFRLVAVSASGHRLLVTFVDGTNEVVTAEVPSGWSDTVSNGAGRRANTFSVSPGTESGESDVDDTITCRVTQLGKVVAERTTTGPTDTADCGGF